MFVHVYNIQYAGLKDCGGLLMVPTADFFRVREKSIFLAG
jgi:hypothetical protein